MFLKVSTIKESQRRIGLNPRTVMRVTTCRHGLDFRRGGGWVRRWRGRGSTARNTQSPRHREFIHAGNMFYRICY
jgi:hypothetical protein